MSPSCALLPACRGVRSKPHRLRLCSIQPQLSSDGYLDRNEARLPDPDRQPALLYCVQSCNLLIAFVTPVVGQTAEPGLTRF